MAYADAGLRATSLALSAALLGVTLIAAMTMRFAMAPSNAPPDISTIEMVRPPSPPPPKPETPRDVVRPPIHDPIVIPDPQPLQTAQAEPTPTELPVIYTPPQPLVVTDPRWTRRPRDLARFYPERAQRLGIEGSVTLDCVVSMQGALGCVVARETPPGWGFGDAALAIAREHRMVPATRDGAAVEARYRMRVPFQLD